MRSLMSHRGGNRGPGIWVRLGVPIVALAVLAPASVLAQGSIFGTVQNANLTNPAVGELYWMGFLDNTDEEIRIESSTGAGYDGVFWFDDFQNYTTEAVGNPYDFVFVNTTNGQYFRLEKLIPNNSFQQEDILLASATVPSRPTGLTARVASLARINVSWTRQAGVTYHVYRRATANNSAFRRIDDATGNLANAGVNDSFFVDATSDGASNYTYMIVGQNGSGIFSAHSIEVSALASSVTAPTVTVVVPDSGSAVAQPTVTVRGTNFDVSGVTVTFGGSPATNIVVLSPFELTCRVPTGTPGPVNVVVTNIASALASAPLVGGFRYLGNQAPVLAAIGAKFVNEGQNLNFGVSATDADGTIPTFVAENTPANASFVDNLNGTGSFNFNPNFTQSGLYLVRFIARDGTLADTEIVSITVTEIDRPPVLAAIGARLVDEGQNLNIPVSAADPDGAIPVLTAENRPLNSTFLDLGNGSGSFSFSPDFTQAGPYSVRFIATSGPLADTELVSITVNNVNRAPVLATIGARFVDEGQNLNFGVSATDLDLTPLTLSAENRPAGATFIDNGNGTGTFDFTPTFTQSGPYSVRFIVSDGSAADTEIVLITVNDVNRPPVLATIGARLLDEGQVLNFGVSASDPEGTIPSLRAENVPTNASFLDNLNGTGSFSFSPNFNQSGLYNVRLIASDGSLADTEIVAITVNEIGNQKPVLAPIGARVVDEGQTLVINLSASDPDGTIPAFTAEQVPANASILDNGNGTASFIFSPDFSQSNGYLVRFIASDGLLADSEMVAITVNNVNRPPILATIGPRFVNEGQNLNFGVSATDPDGTIPSFVAVGTPLNATFVDNTNGTGTFNFNPSFAQAGVYNVRFIAGDGTAADTELVAITVNEAGNQTPVLAAIGPKIVAEGITLQFRVSAADADGTIPTLSAIGLPPNAGFLDSLNGAGGFVFTPDLNQGGNAYQVTFIASDGAAADSEAVFISVTETGNQAPVFDPIAAQTTREGDTLVLRVHAVDPEGGPVLMGTLNSLDNALFVDSGNGYGSVTYRPDYMAAGVDTLRILAIDFGSPYATATLSIIITTQDRNLPPNLWPIGSRTVLAGDSIKIRIVATDSTAGPGSQLVLAALNLPPNATFVDSGGGIGKFKFKPTFAQIGAYNISFIATDNGSPAMADLETITITVQSQNRAPVLATIGPKAVDEGDTLAFRVTATDPDGTVPFLTTGPLPPNAAFVDSGNGRGSLTFMPNYLQAALYQVNFTASDGLLNDAEVVLIQVREAGNQKPNLNPLPDSVAVLERNTILMLVSATDPESQTLTLAFSPLLDNATFTDSGNGTGVFRMTPDYWQDSVYTLLFTATDTQGAVDSAFVILTILDAGNQKPVVAPLGQQTVIEKNALVFTVTASDPDRTTPSLAARPLPPRSSFVDAGDGTGQFSMVPDYQDAGTYNVYFVATDAEDAAVKDSALVQVIVLDRTRTPQFDGSSTSGIAVTMQLGDSITIWYHASDADGPSPKMAATNLRAHMVWADSGRGYVWLTYRPALTDAPGAFAITFSATDSVYDTVVTTTNQAFNVGFRNSPPVLAPIGAKTVIEGDSLVFVITATDSNGTVPVVSATGLPPNATFTSLGGGQGRFRFLPSFTQAGTFFPLFRAQDASSIDTERVAITVLEAGNRLPQWITTFPTDTITLSIFGTHTIYLRATDLDNPLLILDIVSQPTNSTFRDSLNNRGFFLFDPDSTNAGQVYTILFLAKDLLAADTGSVIYKVISFRRGDWNYDNRVDVLDVTMQVNYVFRGGPAPSPFELGNYNGDSIINVLDLVTLIDFVFRSGPPLPP